MAVLTYSEIQNLLLDRAQANVAIDGPASSTELARFINDAYADVYEAEGGSIKIVNSATGWTLAAGVLTGLLTDIKNIEHLFASTASGSTGDSAGDTEVNPTDMQRIRGLKESSGFGSYTRPQLYAVERLATTVAADIGKLRAEYWPPLTGFFYPMHYVPMLTPIDAVTVTTPDVTDLGSRDIALIAALRLAPLIGRAELAPSIALDISERTTRLLERKLKAWLAGEQETV